MNVTYAISSLNSRLYIICRLQSHLSKKSILKLVGGLFTSKLRYGLQLNGKVRISSSDPICEDFKEIQLIQNNLLRSLNDSKLRDMVSITSMLTRFGMSSVNQLNAQCKLLEIWKALNVGDYPLKSVQQTVNHDGVWTRADSRGRPLNIGKSNVVQRTCVSDAIRLWNQAPQEVTSSPNLSMAKSARKKYARKLPV